MYLRRQLDDLKNLYDMNVAFLQSGQISKADF